MTTLFTIPIEPIDAHPGGTITLTTPSPKIYLLTISSPPDNRLTTPFCAALLKALTTLQHTQPPGVLVTTSSLPKFFSNGLDLSHVTSNAPHFWTSALYPLFRKLLSYPMPTVALVNGHAFAAGLMLAMFHDYRVMNPARGFACLNEVDFGALLKAPMSSVFREKLPPATYRSLVLEGRRFPAEQAREAGIVDAVGGLQEALALVEERKLLGKAAGGVWGLLKVEMYRETWGFLSDEGFEVEEAREKGNMAREEEDGATEKKALAKL
ncbi:related to enoyl-CoA hydratase/isomerase [Cephalotrichum gorgonifer]|uniref:Related to enoyl-CoA hydratase/isomerase n=1 Tax=Cephalotrichum gorgonifer TaxID=2041049 RepID=A0AAE8N297_9PEZI|nr:related to enoyl-CoA hydratase/isomerase [Cephalotrichum gorgonifer]